MGRYLDLAKEAMRQLRKPRLICICGKFIAGHYDVSADFIKCAHCHGWMSALRAHQQVRHEDDQ